MTNSGESQPLPHEHMESRMRWKSHVRFGRRAGETHGSKDGGAVLVQRRRDRRAAERFFRKLLKGQRTAPRRLVTDKLRSYSAARPTTMPSAIHVTEQYANNRAEVSH